RHTRDGLHRVAEDVAVVHARAAAELAHDIAKLGVDERVEQHGRAPLRPLDREPQVVGRLGARVADLLELLIRELRLERLHEPRRGRAGGIRDNVQLDGSLARHGRILPLAGSYAALSRYRHTSAVRRSLLVLAVAAAAGTFATSANASRPRLSLPNPL